jgi:hypothetical protein
MYRILLDWDALLLDFLIYFDAQGISKLNK